jgi:hypothetical protein
MLKQQFDQFSPLVVILILLSALVLYVYYCTDRHYRIKLLLGPALIAACAGAFPFIGARLGYGWPTVLPESFEYMAHKAIVVGQQKSWIDVLVVSRKPFRVDPRLHRVPWSKALEDALNKAQAMKEGKEGGDIVMNRSGPEASLLNELLGDAYPDYVPKRVLPQQQSPKSPVPRLEMPGQREHRSPQFEKPDDSRRLA